MPVAVSLPPVPPRLSAGEFEEIRRLAHRAFGLDLKPGKEEMVAARLGRLVTAGGHASYHEYARHIAADASGSSLAALIDALATNHTSFLREPDHFEFFRERVAPQFAARTLTELWCAACSTGQEVWTLACIWNEVNPGRKLRIYASDISNRALTLARVGEYGGEACMPLPGEWLRRYFERVAPASHAAGAGKDCEPRYRAGRLLRSQVEFQRINLMQPLPWTHAFPAIFCRNVMIYFNRDTQKELVRRLTDSLEPGGYLFTGHAESLAGVAHTLDYVQPALYRKPGGRRAA